MRYIIMLTMFTIIITIFSCEKIEEMQREKKIAEENKKYTERVRERARGRKLKLEKVLEKTGKQMLYKVELQGERDEPDIEYQFYGKLIIAFYNTELPYMSLTYKGWTVKAVGIGITKIPRYEIIHRIWQLDDNTYLWQTTMETNTIREDDNKIMLLKYSTFQELEKDLWKREVPKHLLNKLGIKTKIIIGP